MAEMNHKEFMGCELKVEESKQRGGKGDKGDRGGREMKPGDWTCFKCNAMNFARRSECFRCYAPGVRHTHTLSLPLHHLF
jgi:hypothetical protein